MLNLILNKKKDVLIIIKHLLPLSKHSEKIRKMKFALKNIGKTWEEIESELTELKEEIKKEILKS